jgi:beta-galactosidase
MKNIPNKLHLGAAYYPEHWPEDRWPEDVALMKAAGLTVARMGEFAWSTFEPSEGEFHFDWLDRAIDLLAKNGIVSVLGTPTAAPPAWLTQSHPDTLAVDEFGRWVQHGNRCHYCPSSPTYHEYCRRIVRAMAKHFGKNPHIIGWQFDNEYNRVCYCETCQDEFRSFLADKYQTLENLNQRWSTAYWSQTYSSWEQIPIDLGSHNPGLMLEFKRFISHTYRKFQKIQLDELHPHLPEDVWVTHNFMGWFDGFDHYELSADLDLASWDWYVGTGHHDYKVTGAIHDLTRGFKRQNFWVMETQPGNVNWSKVNNVLDKGEGRVMAWHAVGHGADAVLYWQWRSALGGQEQYHGTLVDQSGQPRPFYDEVAQLGDDFAKVSDLLAGSQPQARVAILNDYDSRWSIHRQQRHHKDFDYVEHLTHYYKPLAAMGIPVDIISADEALTGYRLVIAPALVILTEQRIQNLLNYVDNGGNLILTARTGMKDAYNALLPSRQPGALSKIAGIEVEEYYALDEMVPVKGNWFTGHSRQWAERLKLTGEHTQAIAHYGPSNGWLDDQVAISVNPCRNGTAMVYYVGAYLNESAQFSLLEHILKSRGIKPLLDVPAGVEVCQRTKPDGRKIYILINHENITHKVNIPWTAFEHLSGNIGSGDLTLSPYGVAVLVQES